MCSEAAPVNRETCPGWKGTLRDASSHGGKSMTATARDQRDSRGALLRAGCRHEWKDTLRTQRVFVNFPGTQPSKLIVRNGKQVF